MRGVHRWGTLSIALAVVLIAAQAVVAAPLTLQSDAALSEPELAITKFASLFVRDLIVTEEPLLTIRVNNPNAAATTGVFRLSLSHAGTDAGGEIGFIETYPVTIPGGGETTWSLNTGGASTELIVDLMDAAGGRSAEDVAHDVKEAADWGNITDWKLRNWGGNESWVKKNIFDWDALDGLDAAGAANLFQEVRGLRLPAGTYTLTVRLTYVDPETDQSKSVQKSTDWQITNPAPVQLIAPRSTSAGFDGESPAGFDFILGLPDLPDGFETTVTLELVDTVTRRTAIYTDGFVADGSREWSVDGFAAFPDLVTGRRYTWTAALVGVESRRVVSRAERAAEFWLTNQPPVIESFEASAEELIEGDRATFTVAYSDDGDPVDALGVEWFVGGNPAGSGRSLTYTFSDAIDEDTVTTVRVDVTDSFGATSSESVNILVAANQPPVIVIESPSDGDQFKLGSRVDFSAAVEDPEGEGLRRVEWYVGEAGASGDGNRIGSGKSLSFRLGSAGDRRITLVAEDVRGAVSRASVDVAVIANQPPQVVLGDIAGEIEEGESIALEASAFDDFDGELGVVWDVNGVRVSGDAYTPPQPGAYLIRASAVDSDGLVGFAETTVTVVPAGRDEDAVNPIVRLEDVAASIREGEPAVLTATAEFPAGAGGTISEFAWLVDGRAPAPDLVQSVGDTSSLELAGLSPGRHVVIVTALTDAGGAGSATGVVTIERNRPPQVTLDGASEPYVAGDAVSVAIGVTDPDGDEIAAVDWTVTDPSGSQRLAGSGLSVEFEADAAGVYSLLVFAADVLGAQTSVRASIRVEPNAPPVIQVLEPEPGSVVQVGDELAIRLIVTDPNGDAIAGYFLNGEPVDVDVNGDAASIAYSAESAGPQLLTVGAVDSRGSEAETSVALIAVAPADTEFPTENEPPVVVLAPVGPVAFGVPVLLQATVTDADSDREILPDQALVTWVINGAVAATTTVPPHAIEHVFTTSGEVSVEVIAVDLSGATGRDQIVVEVAENGAPTVSIIEPAVGALLPFEGVQSLAADVADPEGHDVEVAWLLDGQPILGATGPATSAAFASPGSHRLTARAEDAYGATGEHTIAVSVAAPEGESLPPEIVQPFDNQIAVAGVDITMQAVNVPEEAPVSWRSSITGPIAGALERDGTSVSLQAPLEEGEHVIALLVDGVQRDQATVIVFSGDEAPGEQAVELGTVLSAVAVAVIDPASELRTEAAAGRRFTDADAFELAPGGSLMVLLDTGDTATYVNVSDQPVVIAASAIEPGTHQL